MSQQALDLRRSIQIVWRHKILVGVVVVLGILAGGAYATLHPPMLTSTALVVLPPPAQNATGGNRKRCARSLYCNPRGDCGQQSRCFRPRCLMSVRLCRSPSFAAKFRSEA